VPVNLKSRGVFPLPPDSLPGSGRSTVPNGAGQAAARKRHRWDKMAVRLRCRHSSGERWRGITAGEFQLGQLKAIREELGTVLSETNVTLSNGRATTTRNDAVERSGAWVRV
jgi:hypothetical protein